MNHEFPCTGPIDIEIEVGSGSVCVVAADAETAQVTVAPYDDSDACRTAAEQTRVEFGADRLTVHTPHHTFRRSGRVRIDLRVPVDSNLRAQVGSAGVRAEGRLKHVAVRSGSGQTNITDAAGDLQVETGSGGVRAGRVGGAFKVKTGSGDVAAGILTGPVNIVVASGAVQLDEVEGPVHAVSASGDIGIGAVRGGDVQIRSASGDVTVGVPTGTGVWLDLATISGTTTSDLQMTGSAPTGGPALSLRVNTVSGDIAVRRVGAQHAAA